MANDRIFLSPPHMSGHEQRYLAEAFAANYIAPLGPQLTQFEQRFADYIGVRHAVAVSSGTAAIHLVLRWLGVDRGDRVLCSTLTFCASANPILYQGGEPVFIDVDPATWNLDPRLVRQELEDSHKKGKLPKAIIAVDILGQSADITAIREIAEPYGIPVLEDAAEALGATYREKPAGASAWCSVFSFNGNKIITTGGGGIICTDDTPLAENARFLATQAREPVPYYEHRTYGYNYRMSNVLAAIGLGQLDILPQHVAARRKVRALYQSSLSDVPGISFMPDAPYGESNCWLTTILIDPEQYGATPEDVRQELERHNIESRRVWKPLHMQPVFDGCRFVGSGYSETIFQRGLNLPSGSALTDTDVRRISDLIGHYRRC